ncbi:hypothetical protein LTR10_009029 [Elasticomyces elasticus]|nr:hypothetical protein LTR10_009029 [Elasticomyces elasticus]KAK4964746.1 hypothetical protein LTR42_012690 [Elasticomyces elasticus]
MSSRATPGEPAFAPFEVFEEKYKTVSSHDIKAAVLIPRDLKPGSHPVIVNIHGGYFATGHSLFAPWFNPWQLKLAIDHGAILVSADYRLLPTPNGIVDQIEDLEDFWRWSRTELPALLQRRAPGHSLDFDHLLLVGGSAGGYYAAQVALSHPNEIAALALTYPAVDLKDSVFVDGPAPGAPAILGFTEKDIPSLSESLVWVEESRKVVASKGGFGITPYCVSLTQYGRFTDEVLEHNGVKLSTAELPLERIKAGEKLPKNVWIIHGDADSVVYLRQSQSFVDLVKEKLPETNLRFDIALGEDHAFDMEAAKWEPYAVAAMKFVADAWLV